MFTITITVQAFFYKGTRYGYLISYVLKLNDFCLFVCAELIEELARATDLKFGMRVEDVVATNKF